MEQKTYLSELAREIKDLPKEEQKEILLDYGEHFDIALAKGRTESEIIKGLGTPKKVGKAIMVQYQITKADQDPTFNNVTKVVFAAVGLGMFNLIFVLAPFIAGLVIPLALFVGGVVLLLSPIILLIQDGFTLTYVKEIFLILGYIGVGLIFLLGAIKGWTYFYKILLRYLKFNLDIVRGRKG